jgi:hypothetical protein
MNVQTDVRNPFNVTDVPNPNDSEVLAFAAGASLAGNEGDDNAAAWGTTDGKHDVVEGLWSCRWNGGADPTIPGDTQDKWKRGRGDVRVVGERVYLLFDWDSGARKGLIDARRAGASLVGKYINLTDPKITRPWIGLIVSNERIDGRWTGGRLDFRR